MSFFPKEKTQWIIPSCHLHHLKNPLPDVVIFVLLYGEMAAFFMLSVDLTLADI
jgi:hypothetical protein